MKMQWSIISLLLLLTLASCSKEEFGTAPLSTKSTADGLTSYQQDTCAGRTLVKPKVDILYVVDNSLSSLHLSQDIKTSITSTVNTISDQFDYRIIGTKLIPDTATDYDYRVLTNSADPLPNSGKKIISPSEMPFFTAPKYGSPAEAGLGRTINFINNNGSLFRSASHLLVILVSNGRDHEVETYKDENSTTQTSLFGTRVTQFNAIKSNRNLLQLNYVAITAHSNCNNAFSSLNSYVAMGSALGGDTYNICNGNVSGIFSNINSTLKQEIVPHQYRYWPISFAKDTDTRNSFGTFDVYRYVKNSSPIKMFEGSDYTYHESTQGYEFIREIPAPTTPTDERISGRHFIKFRNLLNYPDCVLIQSKSRTEYFGYIVVPKEPKAGSPMSVWINNIEIPSSAWSYIGNQATALNIKMPYPNSGDQLPAVMRSGFMVKINTSNYYYRSGDTVEVKYIPAPI